MGLFGFAAVIIHADIKVYLLCGKLMMVNLSSVCPIDIEIEAHKTNLKHDCDYDFLCKLAQTHESQTNYSVQKVSDISVSRATL